MHHRSISTCVPLIRWGLKSNMHPWNAVLTLDWTEATQEEVLQQDYPPESTRDS